MPREDRDSGVAALGTFAIQRLCGRLLPDPESGLSRVHAAAMTRMETTAPGSAVQLAAMRAAVASCADHEVLRAWLSGSAAPEGVEVDLDLRWKILLRLATLGKIEREELRDWVERERTAQSELGLVQCLTCLPDDEAKAYGWGYFSGETAASNHGLEAAGLGFWRRGQERLTDPYLHRYFAEVSDTVQVRSGWNLALGAQRFFPSESLLDSTVSAATATLSQPGLDASLRRVLEDETDDLAQGVRARKRFPA